MSSAIHPIRAEARENQARLAATYPTVFRMPLSRKLVIGGTLFTLVALFIFGFWFLGFSFTRIIAGFGQLGTFFYLMMPPSMGMSDATAANTALWFSCLLDRAGAGCERMDAAWVAMWRAAPYLWFKALAETVAIAFLGTLLAALIAFPLAFLASKNVMANKLIHFSSRRFMDSIRGVDTLIWALIWVNVVGLGPFAGVLAVMTSDIGSFGKLFSEAIENADKKSGEGVVSTGGGWAHALRFGIIPEVFPVIASQILYFFESNTRSATIIGIVGAGGIGLHLSEQIRTLEWQHVAFLVLMILVTVAVIDAISSRLRFAVIGNRETATAS